MTLEQAIHKHWADCPALEELLSADRLSTGRSLGTPAPYATLRRESTQPVCRTNAGRLDEVGLRIDLWHDGYSAGRAVVDQIDAAFDGCWLDLDDERQLMALRRTGLSERQHDDGLWQFTLQFSARVFIPLGEQS
jgi:hypothetical protein